MMKWEIWAILIFANSIIEPFFGRIEQKLALSGSFYQRHPVDYKIFIFLGQPLGTDCFAFRLQDVREPVKMAHKQRLLTIRVFIMFHLLLFSSNYM